MALGLRELLIVGGCLSVWVAILRVPFLIPSVVDWDESLYLLIAEGWRHGQIPYVGFWDNKPVGIFAIFALALAAFGDSVAAIRIAGSLTILATAFLLFLIGRREFGSRSAGLLAAFLYPAFTVGLGAGVSNAEIFFVAFTTLEIYLGCGILRALPAGEPIGFLRPFLTGLSFGAAIQVKFLAAGEMLFVFVFLSAVLSLSRPRDPARVFRFVVAFGVGCTICTAMSFAYFAAHGALDDLIFANFIAPRLYVVSPFGVNDPAASLLRLGRHLSYFSSMIVIVLAVMPVMLRSQAWRAQGRTLQALLILGWFGSTLVSAASTGKFFVHYFIPLAAPLSILCALAVAYVWRWRHAASPGPAGIAALVGIIAAPPLPVRDDPLPPRSGD